MLFRAGDAGWVWRTLFVDVLSVSFDFGVTLLRWKMLETLISWITVVYGVDGWGDLTWHCGSLQCICCWYSKLILGWIGSPLLMLDSLSAPLVRWRRSSTTLLVDQHTLNIPLDLANLFFGPWEWKKVDKKIEKWVFWRYLPLSLINSTSECGVWMLFGVLGCSVFWKYG